MKLLKIFIVSHLVFAQDRDANSLARDLDVDEAHRVRIFLHRQASSDHRENNYQNHLRSNDLCCSRDFSILSDDLLLVK